MLEYIQQHKKYYITDYTKLNMQLYTMNRILHDRMTQLFCLAMIMLSTVCTLHLT